MLRKFSVKLTVAFCATLVLAMGVTSLLLTRQMKKIFIGELTAELDRSAELIRTEIVPASWEKDSDKLQALAFKFSQASRCRVSLIRSDGVVLADSSLTAAEVKTVENHLTRPEVQAALQKNIGSSVRNSHTIKQDLLYVAVPLSFHDNVAGVIRMAIPLTEVNDKLGHLQRTILWISLLILGLAMGVATYLSRSISRPLYHMSRVAKEIARGNFEAKITEVSSEELNQLAETLNFLLSRVRSTIQELARDKNQLVSVLTNMVEAVAAVDEQGRVIVINPSFSQLFEIDPVVAQGKSFLEVLRHNRINQLLKESLEKGNTCVEEVQTYGTSERVFELHTAPLGGDGRKSGALVVLHDISWLRKLEQIRKDFVANVSHELRTPLASIKGFAETLRLGGLDDKSHRLEFVESIENQTDRMTHLVEDLLDLAQIESGQKPPMKSFIDILPIVEEAMKELSPLAKRKGVVITMTEMDRLSSVLADRKQLKQVFLNLLDNAIKFNKDQGKVNISGTSQEKFVIVKVSDTGVGIPLEDLPRIFERFYRVDKARSRELGGTGLGLSIVKHIVEANGGSVGVSSSFGKGSTFEVVLPRVLN